MTGRLINWLLISLFVGWIFFILGSFFAVQKPFGAANVTAVIKALFNLLTAGWLILIGLGLGSWLLQRFFALNLSLIERVVLGSGLGLGLLGLLAFGLGLLGLFSSIVAYSVTFILTLLVAPHLRCLFRQWRKWQPVNAPHRLISLYLLLISLFAVSLALLPPSDWDGLFYHLTAPKIYLQAGGIVGGFDVPHFNFPSLMEMLFAWAMLLRGDIAAKLLHTAFGLLLTGLIYLMTRHLFGKKAAWPAVVILVSMPMLGTLAAWAYNDLALAFYQLASFYAFIRWKSGVTASRGSQPSNPTASGELQADTIQNPNSKIQNQRWLILCGLFAGLAMGLKYTSFVTPVLISGLIVWESYQLSMSNYRLSNKWGHNARFTRYFYILAFALPALIIALPWYVKTWFFTGNPVYPFLSGQFGGQHWDSFRAAWYASAGTGIGWNASTLLALPWLLTLGVRDANFWDGRTGPLLLLFLPLILFYAFIYRARQGASGQSSKLDYKPLALEQSEGSKIENPEIAVKLLLIYVLVHFGFWTLGVIWSRSLWQSRLLLPGLVGLAPVAGWVWANLPSFDLPQFSLNRFMNIAVALTLVLMISDVALLTRKIDPLPYLIGLETQDEYLTRRLGAHYAAMQQLNETLPPGSKIVFLWEPRSYYCRHDCRPDSILDEFPHLVYQHGSAAKIVQTWQQSGVSHVLIHRTGLEFMLDEQPELIDTEVLQELENRYLQELFDKVGAYQLYVLNAN